MRPLKWGEDGVADSIMKAYGTADPVDVLLKNVLEDSSDNEFSDDILLFWLERETTRDRKTPRWFSPYAEGSESGKDTA